MEFPTAPVGSDAPAPDLSGGPLTSILEEGVCTSFFANLQPTAGEVERAATSTAHIRMVTEGS
eukprot:10235786-Lingulodinium_polyedra.AAC.1